MEILVENRTAKTTWRSLKTTWCSPKTGLSPMKLVFALALCTLLNFSAALQAEGNRSNSQNLEKQIKAAFLERFLGYIEFESASKEQTVPEICVYGDKEILDALKELELVSSTEKKALHREITSPPDFNGCIILFLGESKGAQTGEIIKGLSKAAILTVSDLPGFAEEGGMIELINEGPHIKFILNRSSAKSAGIKFAAQLLSLAKFVVE